MPCPHYNIRIIHRGKGKSAVAAAAYQSGERLYSERDPRTKKFTKEEGEVVYTEIMLPPQAPPEYADRNTLWNAVEEVEPNWNSQLARRFVITLPMELSLEANIELIKEYCRKEFLEKGMIVDLCVHDPAPPGHNPHAHILLTMRPLDEHGHWMEKAKKEYKLLLEAYKEKSRGSVLSDLSERKADTPSVKPPGKDSKGIAADR